MAEIFNIGRTLILVGLIVFGFACVCFCFSNQTSVVALALLLCSFGIKNLCRTVCFFVVAVQSLMSDAVALEPTVGFSYH